MPKPYDLTQLGWNDEWAAQCNDTERQASFPARVALLHRSHGVLWSEHGEHDIPIRTFADKKDIAVGDWFLLSASKTEMQPLRRLERHNLLCRKAPASRSKTQLMAANVHTLLIATSCDQDYSESRIERYLAQAAETGITPIVILTKADLCDDPVALKIRTEQLGDSLRVECVDARDPDQVLPLRAFCPAGQTVVLTGSSGVGKSTLINLLAEADQETCEVSDFNQKGRHTTTARSLHVVPGGGILLDTPGIRELQLARCEHGIHATFSDVVERLAQCQFNNCSHQSEPGCAIVSALAEGTLSTRRWENYQTLLAEQAEFTSAQHRSQRGRRHKRR